MSNSTARGVQIVANAAGQGHAHLSNNPSQFRLLQYKYPLKLISPSPLIHSSHTVHTLFLLAYGGGLVAGDSVDLTITQDADTRLVLLTQGSTKVFKTPHPETLTSSQLLTVHIAPRAALCYIPEPVQPFADSAFKQSQLYRVNIGGSLCVCDWVCCGRAARAELWDFWKYGSRNEVWVAGTAEQPNGQGRLLLRDNLILDRRATAKGGSFEIAHCVDGMGVFGSLILYGPIFDSLAKWFVDEFERMPRIGEKRWEDDEKSMPDLGSIEGRRQVRLERELKDGLIWTAARVRGCVLVKFGAPEVEGVKVWLRTIMQDEGSILTNFGERAILCLK